MDGSCAVMCSLHRARELSLSPSTARISEKIESGENGKILPTLPSIAKVAGIFAIIHNFMVKWQNCKYLTHGE